MATEGTTLVAVPLGDGTWIALTPPALAQARAAATAIPGLSVTPPVAPCPPAVVERWVTFKELAALTGVGSATLEALAGQGVIQGSPALLRLQWPRATRMRSCRQHPLRPEA
jgi:hypothetical protein